MKNEGPLSGFFNNYDTNPKYPGEFYFVTEPYKERMLRIKNFPVVRNPEKLFRKFTEIEVKAIVNKIKKNRTIPVLPFVKEIMQTRFEMDVKPPFWFIPFVIATREIGCFLYFEQNGFCGNFQKAGEFNPMFGVEHIDSFENLSGFGEEFDDEGGNKYKDTVATINISLGEHNLTFFEFFGKGYGSQFDIIEAIWTLWSEVVEKNRNSPIFVMNAPGNPEIKTFDSWDEVIEWAQDGKGNKKTNKNVHSDNKAVQQEKKSSVKKTSKSSGDPLEDFREFMLLNFPEMNNPKNKPYGSIRLPNKCAMGYHVRKDHIAIQFISQGGKDVNAFRKYFKAHTFKYKGVKPELKEGIKNPDYISAEYKIPYKVKKDLIKDDIQSNAKTALEMMQDELGPFAL